MSVSISTTSYCEAHDIECENDGECEDVSGLDRYRCVCSDIYDGQHCQHRIDFCEDDPCGNGACSNKVYLQNMFLFVGIWRSDTLIQYTF